VISVIVVVVATTADTIVIIGINYRYSSSSDDDIHFLYSAFTLKSISKSSDSYITSIGHMQQSAILLKKKAWHDACMMK
jgi:hypothetical protein